MIRKLSLPVSDLREGIVPGSGAGRSWRGASGAQPRWLDLRDKRAERGSRAWDGKLRQELHLSLGRLDKRMGGPHTGDPQVPRAPPPTGYQA